MFIVLGQAAEPSEPAEGAFDDPAFWRHLEEGKFGEKGKFGAFDDRKEMAEDGLAPVDNTLFVAAIDKDFEQVGQDQKQADQHEMGAA